MNLQRSVRLLTLFVFLPTACLALAGDAPSKGTKKPDEPAKPSSRTVRDIEGWTVRVDDRLLHAPNEAIGTRALRFLDPACGSGNFLYVAYREMRRLEAAIILIAGMGAFPSTWKHKLLGMAVGIAAVQVVNLVRIISLYYLGKWNMTVFEFAHLYLWQALIMLDVLVVWMLWIRWVAKHPAQPAVPHAA